MLNTISDQTQNPPFRGSILGGRVLTTILIVFLMFQSSAMGQNINSRIGAGGQFIIESVADTFMTVTQSTGYMNIYRGLTLPVVADNSTAGTVYKGADRFIHTYEIASTNGQNTFIGVNSGNFTMTGGSAALASYNTAVGHSSLTSLTTGYYNSAFGRRSLYYNTDGSYNSAFGRNSLYNNSSGSSNSAFGESTLFSNTTASYNSAFGYSSLHANSTGSANSAFGATALYSNTEGIDNSAFGSSSLETNSTGNNNSAFGRSSLNSNTIGSMNSAFGYNALHSNTEGYQNSAFGYLSLNGNTTGSLNSAFGRNAGSTITTGSNLTCIGNDAQPSAIDATNEITIGNSSVTTLRCHTTTITALSDARDKKNIRDLNLGIDFLMKVKPRLYNWDRRDWYENKTADGSKMEKIPTAGFIAQELNEVQTSEQAEWLKLVLKNNPDRLEATPGNLLPIMVKAIQDLKKESESKDQQISDLSYKLSLFEQMQKLLISKIEKLESAGIQVKEVKMSENK